LIKKKLYIWACDYSKTTGEGILARLFTSELKKKNIIKVNKKTHLNHKYIAPFMGILFCWKNYLMNRRVAYINYLPLWNTLIFLFLPPNTILGPITGGAKFTKKDKKNFIIRNYLFPILYKISENVLNLRFKNIIFATSLLKKFLNNKTINLSNFNFVFKFINLKKKNKKDIHLIIYYRKHSNKLTFFPIKYLKKILKKKYSIHVIGDILNIKNVINHGKLSNKKVQKLQSRSKYTIASGENFYSLFILECISNHVKIIVNESDYKKIDFYKEKFIKKKLI
jgi:hypothetical protein